MALHGRAQPLPVAAARTGRARHASALTGAFTPPRVGWAYGLASEVERRQELRDLLADVGRLPEPQRAALLLSQMDSMSHREIGAVLGVAPEKVKALVFQARSSLLATREAREAPCSDVRSELTTSRGAALRRRTLRRHIHECQGCREFETAVLRQRHNLDVLLPVLPTAGLRDAALPTALAGAGTRGGRRHGGHGRCGCRRGRSRRGGGWWRRGRERPARLRRGGGRGRRRSVQLTAVAAVAAVATVGAVHTDVPERLGLARVAHWSGRRPARPRSRAGSPERAHESGTAWTGRRRPRPEPGAGAEPAGDRDGGALATADSAAAHRRFHRASRRRAAAPAGPREERRCDPAGPRQEGRRRSRPAGRTRATGTVEWHPEFREWERERAARKRATAERQRRRKRPRSRSPSHPAGREVRTRPATARRRAWPPGEDRPKPAPPGHSGSPTQPRTPVAAPSREARQAEVSSGP